MSCLRSCLNVFRRKHNFSLEKERSNNPTPVATIVNPAVQYPPEERAYERIPSPTSNGRIHLDNPEHGSNASVPMRTTQSHQPESEDFSSLYATVDLSKKTSIRTPVIISTTSATPPPTRPIIEPIYQRTTRPPERYPQYDQVIVRESLHHRNQRLQHEGEDPMSTNLASYTRAEHRSMTGSDIYAEIANNSGSGTYIPSSATVASPVHHPPSSFTSRYPDDTSERYATILDPEESHIRRPTNPPEAMQF